MSKTNPTTCHHFRSETKLAMSFKWRHTVSYFSIDQSFLTHTILLILNFFASYILFELYCLVTCYYTIIQCKWSLFDENAIIFKLCRTHQTISVVHKKTCKINQVGCSYLADVYNKLTSPKTSYLYEKQHLTCVALKR